MLLLLHRIYVAYYVVGAVYGYCYAAMDLRGVVRELHSFFFFFSLLYYTDSVNNFSGVMNIV